MKHRQHPDDDVEHGRGHGGGKDSSSPAKEAEEGRSTVYQTLVVLFFFISQNILRLGNIGAWYWTNGMNGIAMQFYAGQFFEKFADTTTRAERFLSTWTVTAAVTSGQLLLGALIGRLLLLGMDRTITWTEIKAAHVPHLSALHAFGSLATNIGFMYGKASLVQVIKLLGTCSVGVVSSLILVVGAAMSLVKMQSSPPAPEAIIFALVSGMSLSSRNVLQRKHHHDQEGTTTRQFSKLAKSIIQFTFLSFYAALWTGGTAAVSFLFTSPPTLVPNFQVFLWHPLYNIFSMITLGFCLALTHSLLNAGKRVAAICMAMIWFSEGFNVDVAFRLFLVGAGGCWYSYESKQKPAQSGKNKGTAAALAAKVLLAAMALSALSIDANIGVN